MTLDQITISVIIAITFLLFLWGKLRHDIVAIIALLLLVFFDIMLGGSNSTLIVDLNKIFLGFGHPAVITVVAVLIISKALQNSGVVDIISRGIKPYTKNQTMHITSLSGLIALLSAFMNNVGALALLLPVTLKTAWDQKRSPSILLMPIAFASILGGMITMIGTPPNIIISTLKQEIEENILMQANADMNSDAAQYLINQNIPLETYQPSQFGLFAFTPVGFFVAIIGIIFISLIGWRMIPKDSQKKPDRQSVFEIDEYVTEIEIPDDCKLIGKNIHQLNDELDDKLILIKKIIDQKVVSIKSDQIIEKGESYLVQSDPTDLSAMMEEFHFSFTEEIKYRIEHTTDENPTFNEVILTPASSLIGRTRTYLRRKTMNRLTLLAVARQDKPIHKKLRNIKFQIGDVLLLSGSTDDINNSVHILDVLPLAERDLSITDLSKAGLSILIFIFSIMLSMFNIVPTTVSFIGAIICYIFLGILPLKDLYKNIDWPVIVLLGAMIPLSNALLTTGTTDLISNQVLHYSGNIPIWAILGFVMVATMTMSDVINNAATALIMAPISASIAMSLGASIDPFLMAVAVGASCAFLTPIGHQCNALILGPGGYKFNDYWRMGLPLEIIIVAISIPLIMQFWPI